MLVFIVKFIYENICIYGLPFMSNYFVICMKPVLNQNIWYLSFWNWLISLSPMVSSWSHLVTNGRIAFFLWFCSIPQSRCTTVSLSIHLLTGIWVVACFHCCGVQVAFSYAPFLWFGYVCRSGIGGSYDRSILSWKDCILTSIRLYLSILSPTDE